MRRTFRTLLFATAFFHSGNAAGEADSKYGFLSLIYTAVDGPACRLEIDGVSLNDDGLLPGQSSGGLIMPVGKVALDIEVEGLEKVQGSVSIVAGETSAYAVFPQKIIDPKTKKPGIALRIQKLKVEKKGKFNLEVISLAYNPVTMTIAGKKMRLEPLKQGYLGGWNGGLAVVKIQDERIGEIEGSEAGEYMIVVVENEKGRFRAFPHRILTHYLPEGYGQEP